MSVDKDSLLFFVDKPEVYDNLIEKFYRLNDVFVMRLKNFGVEQIRNFLISHRKCIVVFIIENSKDLAMSMLYKICNCSFSLPYTVVIFKNKTQRLIGHVGVHDGFKIFCMSSKDYSDDLVVDWIKKVFLGLKFSVVFPRYKSYLFSSTRFKIAKFLQKIEMFPYLTGYKYVVDAVELYVDNPNLYITKDIYRILASRYKTSTMNIDRCIRHAIDSVWRNPVSKNLKKYYYGDKSDNVAIGKPSVFEFVRYVADKIIYSGEVDFDEKIS